MRRYGWWLFWSLAALLLFFGNGQLWITDSVESNYALTAKEMVLSGDWISPQIYGNYWYDKPVFFYWLTAAGVIAITALAFNLLLINEVAVPFSSLRSDKEIGLELAQSYRAVDEIGVYGKYSTSAVFYSGKKIIKLVPDEDLANFAPKAYSWKVKNVMPFEGINSFGRRGQLLLVKKNEAGKFLNGSNGKWLVTGEKGGWYILKSA